jgi:hypothetical protein
MHYVKPSKEAAHVVVFYRDFKEYGDVYCYPDDYGSEGGQGYKHRGLGINALHTAKVLRKHHIRCDLAAVWNVLTVRKALEKYSPTHAIFEAMWLDAETMEELLQDYPDTQFIVRNHSQIGFLQVEAGAIKILRDLMSLQDIQLNLSIATNTRSFQEYVQNVYNAKCLYLPNLYDIERVHRKHQDPHTSRSLRIGSFGALRLLKNHSTAAAAALMIAESRGSNLEFYMNSGRKENSQSDSISMSVKNMFDGLSWAKFVQVPWADWSGFRRTVAYMDLCIQPSFTETYCLTACDAVTEGGPVVVYPAIDWLPDAWQTNSDSITDIARVGSWLLSDKHAAREGLKALERNQHAAVHEWLAYLDSNPTL